MVLNRAALVLLRMFLAYCLLAAVIGPVYGYFLWKHGVYLHQMQAQGIETIATIEGGRVEERNGAAGTVYLDIAWTSQDGKPHRAANVDLSHDYGRKFIAIRSVQDIFNVQYRLSVHQVRIKYAAADPEQFIISDDPKNSGQTQDEMLPWVELVSGIGIAGAPLFFLLRLWDRRRKEEAAGVPQNPAKDEELTLKATWLILSLAFYGMLASVHFSADGHAMDIKAFGETPFGLPVSVVVMVTGTALFVPIAWMLWHFLRLGAQARKDKPVHGIAPYTMIFYVFTAGGHAHLRRSRTAVLLGALYAFTLCVAWIAYTAMKGI